MGYALEGCLLLILWKEIPLAMWIASALQFPSALLARNVRPPSSEPNGKAILFMLMCVFQGAMFSLLFRIFFRRRFEPFKI